MKLPESTFHLTPMSIYWAIWFFVGFLGPELYFVATNPAGTLSDTVWAFEHLNISQPFDFRMWTTTHWAMAFTVWLLFLWLSLHLPFGLFR